MDLMIPIINWEALTHGGIANAAGLVIEKIDSSRLEAPNADSMQFLRIFMESSFLAVLESAVLKA